MSVPEELFSMAIRQGFTTEGACALLANVQAESAFIPSNLEDTANRRLGMSDQQYTDAVDSGAYQNFITDGAGYGLAQWTWGPRKKELLSFAKRAGVSIGNLQMQKDFLFYEMKASYISCWNLCRNSHDLYAITKKLLYEWENPTEKENNMAVRYGYAQSWYRQFQSVIIDPATEDSEDEQKETKMTQEQAIERILALARSEIGYHEQGDNWTKYAEDLDRTNWYNGPKNGYAWCDVFVDWLFYKCFGDPLGREMICQPTGSAGAGCLYSAQYYKSAGRWRNSDPQPGDQIFFTYAPGEYSHTGIVESISGGAVTTIEGNTSDQVARRQYQLRSSNIAGYGRPRWELASDAQPTPSPDSGGFGRILKYGMKGEDVRRLQEMLKKLGYDIGKWGADGDYGWDTVTAVKKFQYDNSLFVDGEAGPDTFDKLQELVQEKPQQTPETNQNGSNLPAIGVGVIKNGDKGNQVKLAQACLSCLGYSVAIDGIFGNELTKKIKEFQASDGLPATGEIEERTWKKLLDIPFRREK